MNYMDTIDVLVVEPQKKPYKANVRPTLASLAEAIGAEYTQDVLFEGAPFVLICDDVGKLKGRPLNRALRDIDGNVFDIIAGPFLISGWSDGNYTSLPADLMDLFCELYGVPECFVLTGRELHIAPIKC